ncbi:MAG TPA: cytochrome c3 family protein [Candidatus Binataceae bacterium]|nr:cytochrome c3 family protein [Candidatus Binataceae bacterium]
MNRVVMPLAIFLLLFGAAIAALSQRPWAPREDVVQEIPFSHRIHAGVNQIPCQHCHSYAGRSSEPGIPAVARCVGCHGDAFGGSGIQPVTRPWSDSSRPPFEIQWNRVYTLPDFVRFTHQPHIHAGIQCQECHGPVQTMDRVTPAYEINMGFCIDCHTKRQATLDCVGCHH